VGSGPRYPTHFLPRSRHFLSTVWSRQWSSLALRLWPGLSLEWCRQGVFPPQAPFSSPTLMQTWWCSCWQSEQMRIVWVGEMPPLLAPIFLSHLTRPHWPIANVLILSFFVSLIYKLILLPSLHTVGICQSTLTQTWPTSRFLSSHFTGTGINVWSISGFPVCLLTCCCSCHKQWSHGDGHSKQPYKQHGRKKTAVLAGGYIDLSFPVPDIYSPG